MKREFKMSTTLTELELHSLFGTYAKYIRAGNFYMINFNGKDLSADTPNELFVKVKEEYKRYADLSNYYKEGI
jgi:hypothetical protein